MSNKNTIITAENIDVRYGQNIVLSNVSFDLNTGESLVIIGRNGSGKTSLMKKLTGILPHTIGNLWLKGEKISNITPSKLIKLGFSYFIQGGLILPLLTVYEHLELSSMKNGKKLKKISIDDVFIEFPILKKMKTQKAGNLSAGERQLLSFGVLLMQETDSWLLDEPTAGLAPEMVQSTTDFLQRKNKEEGVSMLIIEHNMEVAFRLATNVAVTKEGILTKKFAEQEFKTKAFLDEFVYN